MSVLTNSPLFKGTNFPDSITGNITLTVEKDTDVLSLAGSNVSPTAAFVGETVVYTIYIKNSSTVNDAEGVTFTDVLPSQITIGTVTASNQSDTNKPTVSDQTVSYNVGTVAKTSDAASPTTVTITINGTVNAA